MRRKKERKKGIQGEIEKDKREEKGKKKRKIKKLNMVKEDKNQKKVSFGKNFNFNDFGER